MFAKSQLAFLTLSVLFSTKDSVAAPIALRNSNLARASIGNFGKCSVPQIKFGVGFDNRKETSFEPADLKSYNHGSAQNIDIITQFICDQLVNSCGADQTAKNTCATAKAKADTGAAKTGVQADLFNGVFGIKTNFAAVASVDDQGRVVAGTGSASSTASSGQAASNNAGSASTGAASSGSASTGSAASSSGIGNFGKCSVPQIQFAVGFDNRKETSFEPVDLKSYNHGSAQNIDIITQFICDQLVNSCGADQTAKNTCATAKAKADTGAAKTGVQADLFNSVFGIKTNFAAVASVDDQGRVVAGTGSSSSATASSGQALVNAGAAGAAASSSGIGNFGKCSVPQIQFAVGFDNRKETSFEPVDLKSYNHGSAQNIDIITQFICDQLVNSCGADQTAKNTCATAKAKADTGAAKTGVQADLFNGVFGIKTNFAAVASVDDQGRVVAGTGSGSAANNAGAGAAVGAATAAATITAAATAASVDPTAAAIAALSAEGSLPPVLNKAASIAIAGAAADAEKESAALASLAGATAANNAGAGAAAGAATAAATTAAVATATAAASNASGNLQKFTGALGGITPPAVTNIGKGQFQVDGNSAFNNLQNALVRSCDVQHNKCANAANASGNKGALTVNACGTQQTQCNAQAKA